MTIGLRKPTWWQLDARILSALRAAGCPVPERELGHRLKVDHLGTLAERGSSLERLEGAGLIRRLELHLRDRRTPLLDGRDVVAYEAIGGGSDA